jgi:holo-[acyl-carrier protein] synthase
MILGIGNDIVHINRIQALIEQFNDRFIERSFSPEEIEGANRYPHNDSKQRASYFAKRFAAKEAFVKALGTGFRNGLQFKQIYVTNNDHGQPVLHVNGKAEALITRLSELHKKDLVLHVTLSDDYPIALATVIIETR